MVDKPSKIVPIITLSNTRTSLGFFHHSEQQYSSSIVTHLPESSIGESSEITFAHVHSQLQFSRVYTHSQKKSLWFISHFI